MAAHLKRERLCLKFPMTTCWRTSSGSFKSWDLTDGPFKNFEKCHNCWGCLVKHAYTVCSCRMVFCFPMRHSCLVHFLPSEPRNVWFTSMEQRGQQGLHVKQWIPMEQHKACSLKLETGIATPKLAIRKHHPLANDLQAQDSTAASRTTSIKEWRTSKQYTCYI